MLYKGKIISHLLLYVFIYMRLCLSRFKTSSRNGDTISSGQQFSMLISHLKHNLHLSSQVCGIN